MNTTYRTTITIHTSIEAAWEAITHPDFAKDFLPETKKEINELCAYIRKTHCNVDRIQPSYVVPGKIIGWSKVAGMNIHLPRKDVEANINAIDIQLKQLGNSTKVSIEVSYSPEIGKNFLLAHYCVRGLFGIKLKVLKKNLKEDSNQTH